MSWQMWTAFGIFLVGAHCVDLLFGVRICHQPVVVTLRYLLNGSQNFSCFSTGIEQVSQWE
jgi:hypothetical protein